MGADVYLESVTQEQKMLWEPKFREACANRDELVRKLEANPVTSNDYEKRENYKAAQKEVEKAYDGMFAKGYFRDPYNGSGLFAQTELSWWRDVVPMLTQKGYLPIAKARKLKEMVLAQELKLTPSTLYAAATDAKKIPCLSDEEWEKKVQTLIMGELQRKRVDKTLKLYEDRRKDLVALLDESIAKKEPLYCSL